MEGYVAWIATDPRNRPLFKHLPPQLMEGLGRMQDGKCVLVS